MKLNVPCRDGLVVPTFKSLKELGGSGTNDEILDKIILDLNIPNDAADIPYANKKGRANQSEISYRANLAKTFLKSYGAIENTSRGVCQLLLISFRSQNQILIQKQ